MKKMCLGILLFLASCSIDNAKKPLEQGRANIVSTMGDQTVTGTVDFIETPRGMQVIVDVNGLPPGKHGFHIHEFGDISNDGKAAGDHYNPENTKHGFIIKDGFKNAHAGDFGNITIDESGKGTLSLLVPKLKLSGSKYNIAGRAVIIHEKEDDFGQPTGNAGNRVAGGTIMIVGQ